MSRARALMFLGTGSDVGKSILTAAFCRILRRRGYRVAPFKAQNMALNSFITPGGGEMGRAQVVQAEAAGIDPHVDMNPILLKPTSAMGSQVIVLGRAIGNYSAADYYEYKKNLIPVVRESFERLAAKYDVIAMEGAGSAVELNLKKHDLVNMAMAEMADARCILVGDIDRGGIFAALLGSFSLLEPHERERMIGFIVNKLRGDPRLFADGSGIIESRSGLPVFGVVPYFNDIALPEEDSVALSRRAGKKDTFQDAVSIGVVRLPFISNYTDFDSFEQDPRVSLLYFDNPAEIFGFDALILPGSKNTIEDLDALLKSGMADAIRAYHKTGGTVVGLCGGYQMMGTVVRDPHGVESALEKIAGLGLLDMETEMYTDKVTSQVEASVIAGSGAFAGCADVISGYEIHMGRSVSCGGAEPLFRINRRDGRPEDAPDGLARPDGTAWGTYMHGIFDNDGLRNIFLEDLARKCGKLLPSSSGSFSYRLWKDEQYDLLADRVGTHVDVDRILDILLKGN
ncbi:MAG: cobyric acid synthase [Desulfobacteraceae bacterium]|nr:cobyric acid synthase [Desulfobacteraceae bacterium]